MVVGAFPWVHHVVISLCDMEPTMPHLPEQTVTAADGYEQAYVNLLDHLGDCTACHMEYAECSEGDRLRTLVRDAR